MLRFFIKKIIQGVLMIVIVSAITFALLSSAGGDALTSLRENPQISPSTIAELERVYGLDRPPIERYGSWLTGALRGDLGESFAFRLPVSSLVFSRFLYTALISLIAMVVAGGLAMLLAVLSVRYPGRTLAACLEGVILITASTPRMVLALVALVLMLQFMISATPAGEIDFFKLFAGALVLAIPLISPFLAQLRDGFATAMKEDFVRVARAKGLSEWRVITRHASRAAINPFLTLVGLSLGALLGGSVIVETVLGWPGIGALLVGAVRGRDIPLVMGVVLISSVAVWLGNLIAELLQILNDKRLRA